MKKYVLLLNILLIALMGSRVSAQEDVAIAFTTCVETVYEAAEKLSCESGLTQQKAVDLMNDELVKQALKTLDQYDIQDKQIYAAVRLVAQELENEEVDEILQQVENSQAQSWFARHPVLTSILTAGGLLGSGYGLWYWWKHGGANDIRNPNQEDNIDASITSDTDTDVDNQNSIGDEEENGSFSEQEKDVDSSAAHDEPSDPNSNVAERATMESPVKEDTELDLLIAELGGSKEVVTEEIVEDHNATIDVADEAGTTETESIDAACIDEDGVSNLPLDEGSTEDDELLVDDSGMSYPNSFLDSWM
ncbi:MAG TPA: hypothetical protein PLU71_02360 [Candidatus Dependentiae bacterium]|nr:hypothetical protein [Candidatus Dependentiae bacterium]HRQ62674.1 hypothetical protein [Candidatus Dependentiae bacterium]